MDEIGNKETLSVILNIGITPDMDETLKELAYRASAPGVPVKRQDIIRLMISEHPTYRKAKAQRRTVFS
jgi:hypothetical protein